MIFGFTPIKFTISKNEYSLFILGITYQKDNATINSAIGFSLHKWRKEDRKEWKLTLTFYSLIKRFIVKTIMDDFYLICNYCDNPVWKHNHYCKNCKRELERDETTMFIYRHPNK
jgi:hypothetical protein